MKTKEFECKETLELFQRLYEEHGKSHRALVAPSWERLKWNYRRALGLLDESIDDKTVMDVGCGFCGLYMFLLENGIRPSFYYGVDIVSGFIEESKKDLAGVSDVALEVCNFYDLKVSRKYDIVFGLGMSDSIERDAIEELISGLFRWSKKYIVFETLVKGEYSGVLKSHDPKVVEEYLREYADGYRYVYDQKHQVALYLAWRDEQ